MRPQLKGRALSSSKPKLLIRDNLRHTMAPHSDFTPNPWNPNRMDGFMRGKLHSLVKAQGFMVPLVVRPNKAHLIDPSKPKWEIIDGEQRWTVVGEEFDVSEGIPFVDAGDVSDAKAKALTVSLNDLKGQHDTMELAKVVTDIIDQLGMMTASELLPYTAERLDSYAKIAEENLGLMTGVTASVLDGGLAAPGGGPSDARDGEEREFGSFDPSKAQFKHSCPKCGYQFN